jgi:hypothetical protein
MHVTRYCLLETYVMRAIVVVRKLLRNLSDTYKQLKKHSLHGKHFPISKEISIIRILNWNNIYYHVKLLVVYCTKMVKIYFYVYLNDSPLRAEIMNYH